MDDIYQNIEEYNPYKKAKNWSFLMVADMLTNKKLNPTLTGLITKRGKLNIFLVFIIQCYFSLSNTTTSTYVMMEIKNKQGV